ncbi:MAG TPA: hypothetical protein VER12_10510 [Polyangiaceae bacterium]|nr:hypothetical protein [Polyangiaceae bacterium]
MKVSLILCACLAVTCTQLAGCGAPAEQSSEPEPAQTNGAWEHGVLSAAGSAATDDSSGSLEEAPSECLDGCLEQARCGQICLTMRGAGSSCQLVPTANDLTRPPRSVHFDCGQIARGPDGYDFDALGHITLMGDTCRALHEGGPHRVALILSCPPS